MGTVPNCSYNGGPWFAGDGSGTTDAAFGADLRFADGPRDLLRLFVVDVIGGAVFGRSIGRGRANSKGRVTVILVFRASYRRYFTAT